MLTTTFNLLRKAWACEKGYRKLAKALGGVTAHGKDTPIPILAILDINGLDDALWSLRAVPSEQTTARDRIARLFACDCAERVMPIWSRYYPEDTRLQMSIEVARRYAEGQATDEELAAAREAAEAAAQDADGDTDGGAAWAAVWATAWNIGNGAAWAAAGHAAWAATRDTIIDAEKKAQADLLKKYLTPVVEPVTT